MSQGATGAIIAVCVLVVAAAAAAWYSEKLQAFVGRLLSKRNKDEDAREPFRDVEMTSSSVNVLRRSHVGGPGDFESRRMV